MKGGVNNLDFINYLYYSINLLFCLLTFTLNGLIAYIVLKKFDFKTTELKLILLLSSFEVVLGIEQLLLSGFKLRYGYHFYDPGTLTCLVFGSMRSLMLRLEIILVTVLALWRYLLVIHSIEKSFKFYVILTIILSMPITSLFLYGVFIQDQKPSPSYLNCFPLTAPRTITTIFNISLTLSLLIPCWFTTYCYFAIGWKAGKKLNEVLKGAKDGNDLELASMMQKEKFKLILQLLMMFVIYNVNFSLTYITHILKLAVGYQRPPFLEFFVVLGTQISIVLNPLVTISFQPDVNNELKFILVKFRVKMKKLFSNLFPYS